MATGGQMDSNQHNSNDVIGQCVIVRSCDPCIRNKSSKTATVFCKDCNELFCDQCSHLHTIFIPGKHEMVSIQNMDSVPVVVDMKGMDMCQEHDEKIKFFCEDHSKLCCNACVFLHRRCEDFHELSSLCVNNSQGIQDLNKSLSQMKSDAQANIANCKLAEDILTASIASILKELDEICDRITQILQDAKQKLLTEANHIKAEEIKKLGENHVVSLKIEQEITDLMSLFKLLLQDGTEQQKCVYDKRVIEKMQTMKIHLAEHKSHQVCTVSLDIPKELTIFLEKGEDILNLNTERGLSHADANVSNQLASLMSVAMELFLSVDLERGGCDTNEPLLSGLDFLPDGRLVAVDNMNLNCFIVNDMLHIQGTPYKFKTYPYDVVCVSQYEVAVTVAKNRVYLLSVSPNNIICLTREIHTSSQFLSLCCMTPSNLAVYTFNGSRPVRITSLDGEESDFDNVEFPKRTYKADDCQCTYVQSKNTLVLCDRFGHTVYMYDTVKGTSRAITDERIQEPCGAYVGPGDTVFVCSMKRNSIVHLTAEGDILGTYPVDMELPYALCINRDGTRLAVTNGCEGEMKLQVYTILKR